MITKSGAIGWNRIPFAGADLDRVPGYVVRFVGTWYWLGYEGDPLDAAAWASVQVVAPIGLPAAVLTIAAGASPPRLNCSAVGYASRILVRDAAGEILIDLPCIEGPGDRGTNTRLHNVRSTPHASGRYNFRNHFYVSGSIIALFWQTGIRRFDPLKPGYSRPILGPELVTQQPGMDGATPIMPTILGQTLPFVAGRREIWWEEGAWNLASGPGIGNPAFIGWWQDNRNASSLPSYATIYEAGRKRSSENAPYHFNTVITAGQAPTIAFFSSTNSTTWSNKFAYNRIGGGPTLHQMGSYSRYYFLARDLSLRIVENDIMHEALAPAHALLPGLDANGHLLTNPPA